MLPRAFGYRIRQELVVLGDQNAKAHRLVKVPVVELEVWDSEHDVLGQRVGGSPSPPLGTVSGDEKGDFGAGKRDE